MFTDKLRAWLEDYAIILAAEFSRYADAAEVEAALPALLAIAEAAEDLRADAIEYEFEIWQDDAMQAGGTTTTLEAAIGEADHYAMMYGQDGPVEVRYYERRAISDAARSTVRESP